MVGQVSAVNLERQRENDFSPPHHRGTPEWSNLCEWRWARSLPHFTRGSNDIFLQSSLPPPLISVQIACPEEGPCKLVKCQCSFFFVTVAATVYNLDNRILVDPRPQA